MKIMELGSQLPSLQEVLRLAAGDGLILRTSDGKEFLLAEVNELDREIEMVRQQPELMDLLARRSNPGATFTLDQVRAELGLDRA